MAFVRGYIINNWISILLSKVEVTNIQDSIKKEDAKEMFKYL